MNQDVVDIAVSDVTQASSWYQNLLGIAPHAQSLVSASWQIGSANFSLFQDKSRAGSSLITLIASSNRKAMNQEFTPTNHVASCDYIKTSSISDLDGNRIVFAQAR